MQFRNKMNIRVHPHFGLAALLFLSFLIAIGSAWKMSEAERNMRSVLTGPLEAERLVSDWAGNIASNMKRTTVLVESRDPALVGQFVADVAASSKRNTELMKKVEGLLDTEQERILFAKIEENRKAYHAARDTVFKLMAEGRGKDAWKALEAQYMSVAKRYQEMVALFVQFERQQLNNEVKAAVQDEEFGWMTVIGLVALAFLLGTGFALWLAKGAGLQRRLAAPENSLGHNDQAAAPNAIALGHERSPAAEPVGRNSDPARNWDEFYDILA